MSAGIDPASFDFHGKRVLVTGAAGGIGGAMARAFAAHGGELVLADRTADSLEALAGEIGAHAVLGFDQADPIGVQQMVAAAGAVDVLLNNAGILRVGPVVDSEPAEIAALIDTNLLGPILVARGVAAGMLERDGGVIVNTSSQLAFCGAATRAVYATTKAGISHFTKAFAAELAPKVRMTALAPGRTLSPMTEPYLADPAVRAQGLEHIPAARYGEVDEMARLALFLASPVSAYVVGETLIADGGFVTV